MLYKWKKAATTPCGLCVSFGTFTYTAVAGRATERKAGGANCSRGPHNTQCFKVWGPHKVNQQ